MNSTGVKSITVDAAKELEAAALESTKGREPDLFGFKSFLFWRPWSVMVCADDVRMRFSWM